MSIINDLFTSVAELQEAPTIYELLATGKYYPIYKDIDATELYETGCINLIPCTEDSFGTLNPTITEYWEGMKEFIGPRPFDTFSLDAIVRTWNLNILDTLNPYAFSYMPQFNKETAHSIHGYQFIMNKVPEGKYSDDAANIMYFYNATEFDGFLRGLRSLLDMSGFGWCQEQLCKWVTCVELKSPKYPEASGSLDMKVYSDFSMKDLIAERLGIY